MTRLNATPLTPTIGAELSGLDFSKPISQADYDAVYDALIEYEVIFFRDQELTPAAHLDLARSFGEPEPPHPIYPYVAGYPQVMLLDRGPEAPPDNDQWHVDVSFKEDPPFASIIYSKQIPPLGGDTLWASRTAAYEALPDGIKAYIADLRAVHDMSDWRNLFTVGEPDGAATS
jgi:taurine dioxygenase